jgi:transcriptional regulator with XRE-family HTH domain
MNEIQKRNGLTLDEHIEKIRGCLERTRQSIFDTIISIKECRDQLGDDVFQKDVSERLGMSPSTLNRWISIGNSDFVLKHQSDLPPTFSSLYNLAQLEKKYVQQFGPANGPKRLEKLVDQNQITPTTEQSKVRDLIKDIDEKIREKNKKIREQKILDLDHSMIQTETSTKTHSLSDLSSGKLKFRSFLIFPKHKLLRKWGDPSVLEMDIADEFPIHDLRSPSMSKSVSCLIVVPMKSIDVGIKILTSFGFTYRDTFVCSGSDTYVRQTSELVMIRGERGGPSKLKTPELDNMDLENVTEFANINFPGPHLLVFEETNKDGWTCLVNQDG